MVHDATELLQGATHPSFHHLGLLLRTLLQPCLALRVTLCDPRRPATLYRNIDRVRVAGCPVNYKDCVRAVGNFRRSPEAPAIVRAATLRFLSTQTVYFEPTSYAGGSPSRGGAENAAAQREAEAEAAVHAILQYLEDGRPEAFLDQWSASGLCEVQHMMYRAVVLFLLDNLFDGWEDGGEDDSDGSSAGTTAASLQPTVLNFAADGSNPAGDGKAEETVFFISSQEELAKAGRLVAAFSTTVPDPDTATVDVEPQRSAEPHPLLALPVAAATPGLEQDLCAAAAGTLFAALVREYGYVGQKAAVSTAEEQAFMAQCAKMTQRGRSGKSRRHSTDHGPDNAFSVAFETLSGLGIFRREVKSLHAHLRYELGAQHPAGNGCTDDEDVERDGDAPDLAGRGRRTSRAQAAADEKAKQRSQRGQDCTVVAVELAELLALRRLLTPATRAVLIRELITTPRAYGDVVATFHQILTKFGRPFGVRAVRFLSFDTHTRRVTSRGLEVMLDATAPSVEAVIAAFREWAEVEALGSAALVNAEAPVPIFQDPVAASAKPCAVDSDGDTGGSRGIVTKLRSLSVSPSAQPLQPPGPTHAEREERIAALPKMSNATAVALCLGDALPPGSSFNTVHLAEEFASFALNIACRVDRNALQRGMPVAHAAMASRPSRDGDLIRALLQAVPADLAQLLTSFTADRLVALPAAASDVWSAVTDVYLWGVAVTAAASARRATDPAFSGGDGRARATVAAPVGHGMATVDLNFLASPTSGFPPEVRAAANVVATARRVWLPLGTALLAQATESLHLGVSFEGVSAVLAPSGSTCLQTPSTHTAASSEPITFTAVRASADGAPEFTPVPGTTPLAVLCALLRLDVPASALSAPLRAALARLCQSNARVMRRAALKVAQRRPGATSINLCESAKALESRAAGNRRTHSAVAGASVASVTELREMLTLQEEGPRDDGCGPAVSVLEAAVALEAALSD